MHETPGRLRKSVHLADGESFQLVWSTMGGEGLLDGYDGSGGLELSEGEQHITIRASESRRIEDGKDYLDGSTFPTPVGRVSGGVCRKSGKLVYE